MVLLYAFAKVVHLGHRELREHICLLRRHQIPAKRSLQILGNQLAFAVDKAQAILCCCRVLLRGALQPCDTCCGILLNRFAFQIDRTQQVLRIEIASVCSLMNACQACLRIFLHAFGTQHINQPQQILGRRMLLIGGLPQPAQGIVGILCHTLAVKIGFAQLVLCRDIAGLCGVDRVAGLGLGTTPDREPSRNHPSTRPSHTHYIALQKRGEYIKQCVIYKALAAIKTISSPLRWSPWACKAQPRSHPGNADKTLPDPKAWTLERPARQPRRSAHFCGPDRHPP